MQTSTHETKFARLRRLYQQAGRQTCTRIVIRTEDGLVDPENGPARSSQDADAGSIVVRRMGLPRVMNIRYYAVTAIVRRGFCPQSAARLLRQYARAYDIEGPVVEVARYDISLPHEDELELDQRSAVKFGASGSNPRLGPLFPLQEDEFEFHPGSAVKFGASGLNLRPGPLFSPPDDDGDAIEAHYGWVEKWLRSSPVTIVAHDELDDGFVCRVINKIAIALEGNRGQDLVNLGPNAGKDDIAIFLRGGKIAITKSSELWEQVLLASDNERDRRNGEKMRAERMAKANVPPRRTSSQR